jgi:MOSC domain-containing protein YiiM
MTGRLVSVNVVHALVHGPGDLASTAIDKRPVNGAVPVERLGVRGDQQYDRRHHGGPDKAVYVYAVEDHQWWASELGRELTPGQFGENFTTADLDVTNAVIGERWKVGREVVVQVTMPRIPCSTFQGWMKEPRWVKRFFAHGAPGAYLRVVEEGIVTAGDSIEVLARPAHGVTIAETFELRDADPARLRSLLDDADVAADMITAVERSLRARR